MTDDLLPVLPADAVFGLDDVDAPDAATLLGELVSSADAPSNAETLGRDEAAAQRTAGKFQVNDEVTAEWAMRNLAEASIRLDEVERMHRQLVAGLDDWLRRRAGAYRAAAGFFSDHLEDYGRRWRSGRKKSEKKSLDLPAGTIYTTDRKQSAAVVDRDAVMAWAVDVHPEIVNRQVRVWVDVPDVKKLVTVVTVIDEDADELSTVERVVDVDTGLPVPGMAVNPAETTVRVVPL